MLFCSGIEEQARALRFKDEVIEREYARIVASAGLSAPESARRFGSNSAPPAQAPRLSTQIGRLSIWIDFRLFTARVEEPRSKAFTDVIFHILNYLRQRTANLAPLLLLMARRSLWIASVRRQGLKVNKPDTQK